MTTKQEVELYNELRVCCENGNLPHLQILLSSYPGLDLNRFLHDPKLSYHEIPKTPLMIAALHDHEDILLELLKQPNININLQDKNGSTALHRAAFHICVHILEILLAHPKLDVNIVKTDGYSALHILCDFQVIEFIPLLMKKMFISASTFRYPKHGYAEHARKKTNAPFFLSRIQLIVTLISARKIKRLGIKSCFMLLSDDLIFLLCKDYLLLKLG